jgi:hypothetical protein
MTDEQVLATALTEDEPVQQTAQWERAECTCPDWCERDHELD